MDDSPIKEVRYIDVTPTWSGILPALLFALDAGTPEGRKIAREELARMARAADAYNNTVPKDGNVYITIAVTDLRIADLLFGHQALYSPWLHSITGTLGDGVHAHFDKESDEEGAGTGQQRFDYAAIQKGLASMAVTDPKHFADFMAENDDALTFDVAWQHIIFGKTIYG